MTTTTPPTAPPTATAGDDELEDCDDAESSIGAVGELVVVDIEGVDADVLGGVVPFLVEVEVE